MTNDEIDPIDPRTVLQMYLQSRQSELADSSLEAHRRRLNLFCQWCEEEGIDSLAELDPRDLHEFRVWRQQGVRKDSISPETLRTALLTLRVYLRFAVSIDAADPELHERLILPPEAKRSREEMLDTDHAEALLDYLAKYEYASAVHVIIRVLWESGIRAGTLRSLDADDWLPEKQALRIEHQPDEGTPLKNADAAERLVAISQRTCEVLKDYLEENHPRTTDEHGRIPLLGTSHGRRSRQSIRANAYYWTCPCRINRECPHGKAPESCEHNDWESAAGCPSSVSTHPIRRGSITHHLREGTPVAVVSERMDVSAGVIDAHYSQLTDEEAMERRREYLPNGDEE